MIRRLFTAASAISLVSLIIVATQWLRTWQELSDWGVNTLSDAEYFPRDAYYYAWWSKFGVGVAAPFGHGMWGIPWWVAATLTALLPIAWVTYKSIEN